MALLLLRFVRMEPAGSGRDIAPVSQRRRSHRENSMKLAGKIALVTGGSRGIGRATALALAAAAADATLSSNGGDMAYLPRRF